MILTIEYRPNTDKPYYLRVDYTPAPGIRAHYAQATGQTALKAYRAMLSVLTPAQVEEFMKVFSRRLRYRQPLLPHKLMVWPAVERRWRDYCSQVERVG